MKSQLLFCHCLLCLFCILISRPDISAQWESLEGPDGGNIRNLEKNDIYAFAGNSSGLYRSADGRTWIELEFVPGAHKSCGAIGVLDSMIVIHAEEFYLSLDHGDTWQQIPQPDSSLVFDIVVTPFAIYVRTLDMLWFSTDHGLHWQMSAFPYDQSGIASITTYRGQVVAGGQGGLYFSAVDGDTWMSLPVGPPNGELTHIFMSDSIWLALDIYKTALYRSSNYGGSWSVVYEDRWGSDYSQIAKSGGQHYISTNSALYTSTDDGLNWVECFADDYQMATQLLDMDESLLIGTFQHGVLRSDDNGQSFQPSSDGIHSANVDHVAVREDEVLAGINNQGIFDYSFSTNRWERSYQHSPTSEVIGNDIVVLDETIYAISDSGKVYTFDDIASSWKLISDSSFSKTSKLFRYADTLVLVTSRGLRMWNNETSTWSTEHILAEQDTILPGSFTYTSTHLYCSSFHHLYRRNVNGSEWIPVLKTDTVPGLTYHYIRDMYAASERIFALLVEFNDSQEYRILMSSDQGATWRFVDADFPSLYFSWWNGLGDIHDIHQHAFITGHRNTLGIWYTDPDTIQWRSFHDGLPSKAVYDLAYDDEYIYAAVTRHGVWKRKITDITTTSIQSHANVSSLTCYPNPASAFIQIRHIPKELEGKKIYLIDTYGTLLRTYLINADTLEISTETLPDGVYSITAQGTKTIYTGRVVVVHQ